jgi:hypothetical protein
MGKTRNTGFSNNAIQYNNGSIAFVSGSTTLLNISSSGNIVTTGTITANTLVVQTVTSSVSFVTGSTKFGAIAANTHQFTGSVYITGSNLNVGGTTITDGHLMNIIGNQSSVNVGVVLNNTNATYSRIYGLTNVNNNFVLYDYTTNATRLSVNASGSMGIGTTNMGTEANLHLGAFSANEGGQLILQRGTSYASASHLDNYQNRFRILSGNDTTSSAERLSVDMTNGAITTTGPVYRYSGQTVVGGTFVNLTALDLSSSRTYLIQMIPTNTEAGMSYRIFGVIQANATSGTYVFSTIHSQTMDITFSGTTVQARVTNGQQWTFNWSITQLL